MYSTTTTLAQDSENISDIYKGLLLGVVGSTNIIGMCPLLLWLHTKHFHTALKYLPFLKSCHPTLRIYNPVLLGSVLKTEKKKQNVVVPVFSSASMPLYPTSFTNPFFQFCSVLFLLMPERVILFPR